MSIFNRFHGDTRLLPGDNSYFHQEALNKSILLLLAAGAFSPTKEILGYGVYRTEPSNKGYDAIELLGPRAYRIEKSDKAFDAIHISDVGINLDWLGWHAKVIEAIVLIKKALDFAQKVGRADWVENDRNLLCCYNIRAAQISFVLSSADPVMSLFADLEKFKCSPVELYLNEGLLPFWPVDMIWIGSLLNEAESAIAEGPDGCPAIVSEAEKWAKEGLQMANDASSSNNFENFIILMHKSVPLFSGAHRLYDFAIERNHAAGLEVPNDWIIESSVAEEHRVAGIEGLVYFGMRYSFVPTWLPQTPYTDWNDAIESKIAGDPFFPKVFEESWQEVIQEFNLVDVPAYKMQEIRLEEISASVREHAIRKYIDGHLAKSAAELLEKWDIREQTEYRLVDDWMTKLASSNVQLLA